MLVEYTPDGQTEPTTWTYTRNKVMSKRGEMIERVYGDTFERWNVALVQGSARARRVLLWHLIGMEHPRLKYADLDDYRTDQLVLRFDSSELKGMRDNVGSDKKMSEDERDAMTGYLHAEYVAAMRRELGAEESDASEFTDEELEALVEASAASSGKAPTATTGSGTS